MSFALIFHSQQSKGAGVTFLINEKTIILSKLTCAFICLLFHQMVALLWYPFVLSHQCYFISSPSRKRRICVHPCLLACGRDRMVGERLLAMKLSHSGKNRGWRELLSYSQSVVIVMVKVGSMSNKTRNALVNVFFSSHSHRSHLGLVKWIFAKGLFLKTFLSCFWRMRSWRGLYLKPLAWRLGCK